MTPPTLSIDRLADDEWPLLRDLRLAALADAPGAFWATFADESRYGVEEWSRFLRAVEWFVARRGGRAVGLAGGLRRPERPDAAEVIGMWVEPGERGRGTAGALLADVCSWAREESARVVLWVTDGNDPARRLYEKHGFRSTGEREPLPPGRESCELGMSLDLRPPALPIEHLRRA